MVRVNRSRPDWSAPNHNFPEGPAGRPIAFNAFGTGGGSPFGPRALRISFQSWWLMWWAMSGAKIAMRTRTKMNPAPVIATLSFLKRPQKICHGVRPSTSPSAPATWSAATGSATTWLMSPTHLHQDRAEVYGRRAGSTKPTPSFTCLYEKGGSPGFRHYPAMSSTSRGTISTPASAPSDPPRAARPPNSPMESDETPGPVTTKGTGSSGGALLGHEVEGAAVPSSGPSPGRSGGTGPKTS